MYDNTPPPTNLGTHIHVHTSQKLQQITCKYHMLAAFQCALLNVASCQELKCVFLKAVPCAL